MTLLTVFVGIIALSNLVLLGGLAYLAVTVKRLVDTSVKPAISEAASTLKTVNELADKVEEKAEDILDISEQTARRVSGSVVATTDMVRQSVTTPLISVSSVLSGVSRALDVLKRAA